MSRLQNTVRDEATMVSAPRLHTSAAHPPAGDGNQAIKTWPAVSLYLLVAWLAAGGLILLQPITVQHYLRFPQRVFGGPEQGSGDSRGPGPLDPSNPNIRAGLADCPPVRVQLTAGWPSP